MDVNYRKLLSGVFFDKRVMIKNLLLVVLSTSLVALFPIVTQFYIKVAFHETPQYIFLTTLAIAAIYLIKLLIDINVSAFENKLYIKLRANLQGKLIAHFLQRKYSFERMHTLAVQKVSLYVLFVRKMLSENFKSIVKIAMTMILILFFDTKLFLYSLAFLPVFGLYVFLFYRIFHRNKAQVDTIMRHNIGDISAFLHEFQKKEHVWSDYKRFESLFVEKEIRNRNSLVGLNQTLSASITFFRVIYLAYFGYYIITQHVHIEGLIVGLLFITILIRSFIALLETLLFYYIAKSSVVELQRIVA